MGVKRVISSSEPAGEAVLVVGGGIAGIQAALDLADAGVRVFLVERSPSIGGRMAQLDKTFPTDDCSACILSPKMVEVARNHLIELLTMSELEKLEGEPGNFRATVVRHPRYVDEAKCTGCGECAQKCPTKVSGEFEEGLAERSAIYIPFPQAVPLKYAIDDLNCRQLLGEKCGVCAKVCPADAVNYDMKEERLELSVAAVIVTTGFDQLDPSVKEEYGYGVLPDVITSLQFERMLSASGPSSGRIYRPSDNEVPKHVVFVQCVGSRDVNVCEYCSRVCCMSAIKEAQLALEHGVEKTSIVGMDVRAFGKHFEGYYRRAREERGVEFVTGRASGVDSDGNKGLVVCVGYIPREEFMELPADLVVLSSAIIPSHGTKELANVLGVELDDYGFFKERHINAYPASSSREGVFLAGCCQGPKDIPDSVVQSSSAAAHAAILAFNSRNSAGDEKSGTPGKEAVEPEVDTEGEPRIGVFVCDCGNNIAGVVDVPAVVEDARGQPGVVYVQESTFTCSDATQHEIQQAIHEHRLNRVVIASCTPRTHESIFQETMRRAGLNPYLFDMANIRDQCSWVHAEQPEKATEKSIDLVRMSIARARLLQPLEPQKVHVTKRALVIGGGIAGIKAASQLGQMGMEVVLVEKRPFLGGRLTQLGEVFPEDAKGPEILGGIYTELLDQNVDVRTKSEVIGVEGHVGNFKAKIRTHPRGVDVEKCNLCGECEKVCPVEVESLFDRRWDLRKVVYYEPCTQPESFNIDFDNCTHCGECVKACKTGAITKDSLNPELMEEDEMEVGTIVLSIGSDMFKPPDMLDYGMGKKSNVLSNIALERLLHPQGPTEGKIVVGGRSPRSVAFILCIGSRDPLCKQLLERNGALAESIGDCSRYCCQTTLKQAIQLRKLGIEVNVLYTDMRAYEKGGERMYRSASELGTTFIRYDFDRKPVVENLPDGGARVLVYDQLSMATLQIDVDLVVLVLGMTARYPDTPDLLKMLKVPQCGDGFCMEKHIKLAPLETNTEGIFIAGCLQAPKDIAETLCQGSGAAVKAIQILTKDELLTSPLVAHIDREKCSGCRTCEKVCSYNAIQESDWANTMEVNPALCKGCGVCCASCPDEAITLDHFTTLQLIAQAISGVEGGVS